jgi:hypothetical protein
MPIRQPYAALVVKPHGYIYIGEYHSTNECSFEGGFEFIDAEERDLNYVRDHNPAFANIVFEKKIARFAGFLVNRSH